MHWFIFLAATALLNQTTIGKAEQTPMEVVITTSAAPEFLQQAFLDFESHLTTNFDQSIKPILLINGESGSEETTLVGLRRGRIQISMVSIGAAATTLPELSLLTLPYLFDNNEEADHVLDKHLFYPYKKLLEARGLILLRWLDSGWSIIYGKKPIHNYIDIENYRFRSPSTITSRIFFQHMGADVITLPFSDVIPGLQTGLVNSGTTSTAMYLLTGIYSHAPFLTLTNHALNPGVLLANKKWFEGLSDHNKNIVSGGFASSENLRSQSRLHSNAALQKLSTLSVEIIKQSKEERKTWRLLSQETKTRLIELLGGDARDLYDMALTGICEFSKLNNLSDS